MPWDITVELENRPGTLAELGEPQGKRASIWGVSADSRVRASASSTCSLTTRRRREMRSTLPISASPTSARCWSSTSKTVPARWGG